MEVINRMPIKIFIHAVNIHQGGGRKLLEDLLEAIESDEQKYVLTLDERMPLSLKSQSNILVRRIKPSIFQRLMAEVWMFRNARYGDRVLCFGNLPPLFRLKAFTSIFLQNRYLIENISIGRFPIEERVRLSLERLWFNMRAGIVDRFLVQTPSMKRALAHHLLSTKTKPGFCIEVMPFMNDGMQSHETQLKILQKKSVTHDFVYIASGDPHKNHRRLIDAWVLLAEEGFLPSLALTIDQVRFPDLFAWIEGQKRIYNLRIDNKGILTSSQVGSLYNSAGALIFPSLLESFGLPLIEAKNAGLPVLAGELDYVRDILHPAETFDPQSAVSISRAIKRFRYIEEPSLKIVDASVFIKCLHSD